MEPRFVYSLKVTTPVTYLDPNGAVRFRWHSYGAVWCDFPNRKMYGSVRCAFADVVNPIVPFGAVECPNMGLGARLRYSQTYGTVRCGFAELVNPMVRFGAILRYRQAYDAAWCGSHEEIHYGAVRYD